MVRINDATELPELNGIVGVTAGASAPEELVTAVVEALAPVNGVELVKVTDEDEYFPPPRNIRDLQASIGVAAAAMSGGPISVSRSFDDAALSASSVLGNLDGKSIQVPQGFWGRADI